MKKAKRFFGKAFIATGCVSLGVLIIKAAVYSILKEDTSAAVYFSVSCVLLFTLISMLEVEVETSSSEGDKKKLN